MNATPLERRRWLEAPREEIEAHQLARVNELIRAILPLNRFYRDKFADRFFPLSSLHGLNTLPYTFKDELTADQWHPPYTNNLTFPLERYVRFHQTSGTHGRPLMVLDTSDDWRWWINAWQYVLDAAEVQPGDRVFMAFSFGPFVGFWSAFDAVVARGVLAVPSGGMSSLQRLELMKNCGATVICCTPSYALHLADVAEEHKISLSQWHIRCVIVAGEPGGSVPNVRQQIEQRWGAKVIDHAGATEIGPWGCAATNGGLNVIETEFIPEFISVDTGEPAGAGQLAELVLTNLGRVGCPLIRYRTGDLVRPHWTNENRDGFVRLEGGILGRADDMLIVRGMNIFPSSVEQILRGFPEIVEFRITAFKQGAMDALAVEVEDRLHDAPRIARELLLRLGLNVAVECVPLGSLPRFEGKGQRFRDHR